jgi:hypothetical protein
MHAQLQLDCGGGQQRIHGGHPGSPGLHPGGQQGICLVKSQLTHRSGLAPDCVIPAGNAPIGVCESATIQTDVVTSARTINSSISLRTRFFCIFTLLLIFLLLMAGYLKYVSNG